MSRRLALGTLAGASTLILVTFFTNHRAAQWLFAVLVLAFPVALIVLGTARGGNTRPLRWPLVLLGLVLEGCGIGLLALSGTTSSAVWVLGLPPATAILLYGLGLVPLILVVVTYAATFDRFGLTPQDLERIRGMKSGPR